MPDRFRQLRDNPHVLQQLFPFDEFSAGLMCTLAADALDDYLRTGRIEPVRDTLVDTCTVHGTMHVATLSSIVLIVTRHGHGCWAVVRAARAQPPGHWFVVFNADGVAYVADPYLHTVHRNSQEYANHHHLRTFAYHGSWERQQFEAEPAAP